MNFAWKPGARVKLKAQDAGEHLEHLRGQYGALTAELVLEDASDPTSPLHQHFTWDNTEAARLWRLTEARHLLNCIVLLRGDEHKEPIRAFVVISHGEGDAYQSLTLAMGDPEMRQDVLTRAWRELQAFTEKYREYEELAAVFAAIEQVKPRRHRAKAG